MNSISISRPISGAAHEVGNRFFAQSFNRQNAGGQMNPLVMVDHFWMKQDTFGWHQHRAISAVTYVFEDSKSAHHNFDTMGNNVPIHPGSLHWMVAGAGAMHCERPEEEDALVHGLQFFVDLPDQLKTVAPYAIHLDSKDIPETFVNGARVRVVAGEHAGVRSAASLPQPFTVLDVFLEADGNVDVQLPPGWGAWLLSVSGNAQIRVGGRLVDLQRRKAIAIQSEAAHGVLTLTANEPSQVVLLRAKGLGFRALSCTP